MKTIIESVPNFSEGRDQTTIDAITTAFTDRENVKLLDVQADMDHNRMVATVVGERDPLKAAILDAMAQAVQHIDMTRHKGQHPRMGAVDVVPFIPIRGVSMTDVEALAKDVAQTAAQRFNLPIILYAYSATAPHRANLAEVRRGQFEGMADKLADPLWQPDFGPPRVHPTAGVTAIGARPPLVAFNVNLGTDRRDIADAIAKKVRFIGGGLRHCQAMGVSLEERGIVQVSMNMTDFNRTALYRAVEMVRFEAQRYGVPVIGSEIVGLVPMQALADCAAYYMGLENFSMEQVLETHLM